MHCTALNHILHYPVRHQCSAVQCSGPPHVDKDFPILEMQKKNLPESGTKWGKSGAAVFFSMIEWPDKKVHLHGPLIDCPPDPGNAKKYVGKWGKVGRPFFSMIKWPDKKVNLHGPLIDCPPNQRNATKKRRKSSGGDPGRTYGRTYLLTWQVAEGHPPCKVAEGHRPSAGARW
jgi:hypothetical protein